MYTSALRDPITVRRVIQHVESAVDVRRCVVDGINVWPVVRQEFYHILGANMGQFFGAMVGRAAVQGRIFSREPGREQAMPVFHDDLPLISKTPMDLEALKGGALFLEVPGDYTQVINRAAVNKYADGVLAALDEAGDPTPRAKLCRLHPQIVGLRYRYAPIFYAHGSPRPLTAVPEALGPLTETVGAVNRALAAADMSIRADVDRVRRQVVDIWSYAETMKALFETIEPRAIFVQNFNNTEKFGGIVAAKKLGIETVDLQHGIQERTSMYNDNPACCADPDVPYLFPDALCVWGEITERALTEEMETRPTPWRRVVRGGLPWKSTLSDQPPTKAAEALAEYLETVPATAAKVLYCHDATLLSSDFTDLFPTDALQAISRSGADVHWLVRVHPRSIHLVGEIEAFFREQGASRVEVVHCSRCQFEEALEQADMVLTKYSVSALEAMSLGKPAIVNHWVGRETFAAYADHPLLFLCEGPEEILSGIEAARSVRPEPFPYVESGRDCAVRGFRTILDGAPAAVSSASA